MGRKKKAAGSRVVDQFHVGMRFEPELRDQLFKILHHANGLLAAEGFAPLTPSALVKAWVRERVAGELKKRGL